MGIDFFFFIENSNKKKLKTGKKPNDQIKTINKIFTSTLHFIHQLYNRKFIYFKIIFSQKVEKMIFLFE